MGIGLDQAGRALVTAVALLVGAVLVAPTLIVLPMSFSTAISFQFPPPGYWLGYYRDYFTDAGWLLATANSFIIASATTVLTMLLVVPAALAFVRRSYRGKKLGYLLVLSPLIVPHTVAAIGYFGILSKVRLVDTIGGVVLAHTALAIPVTFLVVTAALKGFDRNLERAAMNAGAGPLRTFLYVTFPVLRPAMLVGALFAFMSSFNESVVAIFIGGRNAATLPKKMFESIRTESDPVIAVVSSLLIMGVLAGVLTSIILRRTAGRAA
jgi:putative spermidine/putrescine transport system permease protein